MTEIGKYGESDVADPTIILEKRDNAFIETYAQRLARKQRERIAAKRGIDPSTIKCKPRIKPRMLKNGTVMDEAFMQRFIRLYSSPMSIKMVCVELGMSNNMAYKLAREHNLAVRQHPKVSKRKTGETIAWHLQIDAKLLARVDQHIWMRYRSRQQYITALIKRDLASRGE